MNILIAADLHLDLWAPAGRDPFAGILPVPRDLDAPIIAGDLANDPPRNWPRALTRLDGLVSPERIWVIPGNHHYYGATLDEDVLARIAPAAGAHIARKQVLTFGGCRLLCCTFWTDFALTGNPEAAMARAAAVMPDYARSRRAEDGLIHPEDTVALHRDHLEWLTREMARTEPRAGPGRVPLEDCGRYTGSREDLRACSSHGAVNTYCPGNGGQGIEIRPDLILAKLSRVSGCAYRRRRHTLGLIRIWATSADRARFGPE